MKNYTVAYEIDADAKSVFEALTSQEIFTKWSGQPAEIDAFRGGKFSQFDGNIQGSFIEVSASKIVQSWKEKTWQDFSRVTFTIKDKEENTELAVLHEEIPDESYDMIQEGWDKYYLAPLKQYFENQNK